VLNLLTDRPVEECRAIVLRSFGSFLANKQKNRGQVNADADSELRRAVEEAQSIVERVDADELRAFQEVLKSPLWSDLL
jgi:hypothetical protein